MTSPGIFSFFWNFDFSGFQVSKFWFWRFYRGKRAKDDLKLPISLCFALYLRNCRSCRSYHQGFAIVIWTGVFIFFVFYWPTSTVILINISFSSSSINAKIHFEVYPTFFTFVWLFNHPMIYQICDVMRSISLEARCSFEYIFWTTSR